MPKVKLLSDSVFLSPRPFDAAGHSDVEGLRCTKLVAAPDNKQLNCGD